MCKQNKATCNNFIYARHNEAPQEPLEATRRRWKRKALMIAFKNTFKEE